MRLVAAEAAQQPGRRAALAAARRVGVVLEERDALAEVLCLGGGAGEGVGAGVGAGAGRVVRA